MGASGVWQWIVGGACVACLLPPAIFFVLIKLVGALDGFLYRHSLLLCLIPITLWLRERRREQRRQEEWYQWHQYPGGTDCRRVGEQQPPANLAQFRAVATGKGGGRHG